MPFHTTTQGFSAPTGQPLPTLNLSRVYVLTGAEHLLGERVDHQRPARRRRRGDPDRRRPPAASRTASIPQDNCGTTYFSIQFQGVNEKGFGDYPDGFSPANATGAIGVPLPGCSVADDFDHALGDPQEAGWRRRWDTSVNGSARPR